MLVHEYCSGGGELGDVDAGEAAALRAQGQAMLDAMAADVAALPGHEPLLGATPGTWPALVASADAVWSVAPETGGVLAAIAASVPPSKWLGCTVQAIALAGSKSATRRRLAQAGIAVPHDSAGSDAGPGRFVVKPDDGAGATATAVYGSYADAASRAPPGFTVERWVDGEPMSITLLCARGRAELLAVNRQRIAVDAQGHVRFDGVETAIEPVQGARGSRLRSLASRIADAVPGLYGIVGVDLVWHPRDGPVVIELNPRVTTAYVGLSAKLGRNLAQALLALPR